jgi:ABC-2 type transport system permease protein
VVGLNRSHLWALLRLRGKLSFRLFWREKGRIVSVLVALLFFGPMVVALAIGTAIAYRRLEDPWPSQILGLVLVALWAVWLLSPIILSAANEGADITRLLIYPITRLDLLLSIFLGTLFDYPTYLMLPLFIAILIGFPAVWPVVLLALLLAYGQMVVIGQLSQTLLGGILQSRRFRDGVIIIGSLLGSSCYFLQFGFRRWAETAADTASEEALLGIRPLNSLQWLPTGALARAVEQAQSGAWLNVSLWLFYSFLLLLLLITIWWLLLERITTGEGFFLTGIGLPQKEKKITRPRPALSLSDWLPPDIVQLAAKELKSIWRLPQRRVGLIQGILFPLVMLAAILFQTDSGLQLPDWIGLTLPLYALFMFWALTQNMLAWEGFGLATLLLTPIPRQRIFIAKGLAFFLVAGTPFVLISLVMIGFLPGWQSVAGLITGLNLGLTTLGVASVASVLFPMRINLEAKSTRRSVFSTGGGCLTGLAMVFLVPIVMITIAIPPALPLVLAAWWQRPALALLGSVIAALYALSIFWGGTYLGGQLLLEREAEVFVALKQPEFTE